MILLKNPTGSGISPYYQVTYYIFKTQYRWFFNFAKNQKKNCYELLKMHYVQLMGSQS